MKELHTGIKWSGDDAFIRFILFKREAGDPTNYEELENNFDLLGQLIMVRVGNSRMCRFSDSENIKFLSPSTAVGMFN